MTIKNIKRRPARRGVWMLPAIAIFGALAAGARAESANNLARQGNELYRNERTDDAIESYRQALSIEPNSPVIQYNLGTALARKGRGGEAEQVLRQAAEEARVNKIRRDAYFNLGVSLAEAGGAQQAHPGPAQSGTAGGAIAGGPPATATPGGGTPGAGGPPGPQDSKSKIASLEEAIEAFRNAILNDPADDEAKYNFELAKALLDQLKQQQKQNPQGQQDQQQQNSQQNSQDQQQQQQGGQDQQNQQNQQQQNQQQQGGQNQDQQNKNQQQQQQNDPRQGEQQQNDQQRQDQQKQDSGSQQQDRQDQQPKDQQQQQSQQQGLEGQATPSPTPTPQPGEGQPQSAEELNRESQPSGGQGAGQAMREPNKPNTPEQANAQRLLNMLEEERPEQFKKLYRFRGEARPRDKDW